MKKLHDWIGKIAPLASFDFNNQSPQSGNSLRGLMLVVSLKSPRINFLLVKTCILICSIHLALTNNIKGVVSGRPAPHSIISSFENQWVHKWSRRINLEMKLHLRSLHFIHLSLKWDQGMCAHCRGWWYLPWDDQIQILLLLASTNLGMKDSSSMILEQQIVSVGYPQHRLQSNLQGYLMSSNQTEILLDFFWH